MFWNKKKEKEASKMEQQTKTEPVRLEPLDKNGKSLINGKTIKSVILPNLSWPDDELVVIVFTDGTYMLSGIKIRGFSMTDPGAQIMNPVDRGYLGSMIWSRTANSVSQEATEKENALFKQLIDAGLYTESDINGMIEEGKERVRHDLSEEITRSQKRLIDAQTRLSRIK
jgi:hypothetical protein